MIASRKRRFEGLIETLRGIETSDEEKSRQAVETLRNILIISLGEIISLDEEVKINL